MEFLLWPLVLVFFALTLWSANTKPRKRMKPSPQRRVQEEKEKPFKKMKRMTPAEQVKRAKRIRAAWEAKGNHLGGIRACEERIRELEEEALKYAGTPDQPYVQKLTPDEQETKDRIESGLAGADERRNALLKRAKELGIEFDANGDVIHTGPRGGRYRINRNDRKSYDVR